MALVVFWTEEAESTFDANIAYLNKEWTAKEIKKFITRSFQVIDNISQNPELYPASI